jgi:hypothetical protein
MFLSISPNSHQLSYHHETHDGWHTSIRKDLLSPLDTPKELKESGNTIPLNCTFGHKGIFHIYLQSSKLAWNEACLVPLIHLILLAEIKFLAGISEILNKNSWKPVSFLATYANLGERNNHKSVLLKKALIGVFSGQWNSYWTQANLSSLKIIKVYILHEKEKDNFQWSHVSWTISDTN